jgi:integrase
MKVIQGAFVVSDLDSVHVEVSQLSLSLSVAGQVADEAAARNLFSDYQSRLSRQTLRRQKADLALFARYLAEAGLGVSHLATNPESWHGMSWGLLAGFVQWQLNEGYAVGSINVRLATIRAYCGLAHQAGVLSSEAYRLIQTVKGYGQKQARKVDEKRAVTRRGQKKAGVATLSREQVQHLKQQPATPQGRRDAVLMCLLLDHGLRCGEIVGLRVDDIALNEGLFTFYRPKVDKVQSHKMTGDTWRALSLYLRHDSPGSGPLLLGSRKDGRLEGTLHERSLNQRVRVLGKVVGTPNLSPHDCRHYWATTASRNGTDPFALQEAGGWSSLTMPRRYVDAARIANEGVKLE